MGARQWNQQDHRANSDVLCLWYRALCCWQRFLQKIVSDFNKNCAGKNKNKLIYWFDSESQNGYIDDDDMCMLVILCWWQFSGVGDKIPILVTLFACWCLMHIICSIYDANEIYDAKEIECWRRKRQKLSPTSQSCRQHISSLTSVTNIDDQRWRTLVRINRIGKLISHIITEFPA